MPSSRFLSTAAVSLSMLLVPAVASASATPAHPHAAQRTAVHHVAPRRQHARSVKAQLAAATSASVITGTTYYVSPTGSDTNTGTTPAQAWKTVARANNQALAPGDGILFHAGATFSDSDLEPARSGTATSPIVYGTYGIGQATITKGAWFVQDNLILDNLKFQSTVYGGSSVQGTSNNDTIENCAIALPAGNSSLGLYTDGDHWTIKKNTITDTGLSGLLLNGDSYQITNNTINQTGLDTTVAYNAHGIYLDASDATITGNLITNSAESAISVRYRNSTITNNTLSGAQIGIDFYQTDPAAGTAHWSANTISKTTAADLYVSNDGVYPTHESFVITGDTLKKSAGVFTNLTSTTGTYAVASNHQI